MQSVLTGLVIADVLVLSGAAALGWFGGGGRLFPLHFGLGLFATLYTALLHSIVYVYFIVQTKTIGEAVDRRRIDPAFEQRAKRLKSRTFRVAMSAIAVVMATAMTGAWIGASSATAAGFDTTRAAIPKIWHFVLALLSIAAQPLAAWIEYRNIGVQQRLTHDALAAYAGRAGSAGGGAPGGAGGAVPQESNRHGVSTASAASGPTFDNPARHRR
ncbi:MAG: hypothetical protein CHACPFDD_02546 [Phycisphaerae bacterium]|nr:hypothetical protein [Phycisphaerae bacterium]